MLELPEINILPQIGPLRIKEVVLNEEYVYKNINSATSSLHFRNQLHYHSELFELFKVNAEQTWQGLRILNLELAGDFKNRELDLLVQDNNFVAEIGWMGHGLQMWLQTIWFLTRCSNGSTVILDEPDVYKHADLQRKLIRYLKNKFPQVIVATHSIEIMSEVEPGSIHNIQLARLWSSKKILIVEGKDIEILKRIQNRLLGESLDSLESIPNFSIGGWGGWKYAIGSKLLLKNAGDKALVTYCLFVLIITQKKKRLKDWKRLERMEYVCIYGIKRKSKIIC